MPILTQPRALPGLLMSIARFVDVHGPIDQAELFDLVVPQPLRTSEKDGGAKLTFENTLEVGSRIGLLEARGKSVIASKDAALAGTKVAPEQFLLEWVLSEAVGGEDPFANNDGASSDLARTLCWFLDLDAMDAPVFTGAKKENAPQTRLDMLVSDAKIVKRLSVADAAWSSFARWAAYLGLARVVSVGRSVGVIPDPYVAVRRIVNDALGKRPDPLATTFAKIGERIPVVGGGRLARSWHALYAVDDERDVPPALAYALFRLHDEGVVKLTHVGDADVVWRFRFGRRAMPGYDGPVAPQTLTFSHVARGA
jgi:hypothetical protein